mgnify:CR=1 FL=1
MDTAAGWARAGAAADASATSLIRVVAKVQPRNESDTTLLHRLRTGDPVRVRGAVRGVFLRSVLSLDPAVIVTADAPKSKIQEK